VRIVIVGASGNIGTSLLEALRTDSEVESVLALARRVPDLDLPRTEWARADVTTDELVPLFRGADAVVHLAWLIQPSRDERLLRRTNVEGSYRVFRAVAEAGVGALVYGSSVGAYSRGPKHRFVDESWPAGGIRSSFYGRHKADVESMLDGFEREHPEIRVVRMRPGLVFKRGAASGIRRLFVGPFLPSPLVRRQLVPLVPAPPGLRFQAVHSHDVWEAYRLALITNANGAFNVAADPVLDGPELARLAGAPSAPSAPWGLESTRRRDVAPPSPADAARVGRSRPRGQRPRVSNPQCFLRDHGGLAVLRPARHYLDEQQAFLRIGGLGQMLLTNIAQSSGIKRRHRSKLEAPLRMSFILGMSIGLLDQLGEIPSTPPQRLP